MFLIWSVEHDAWWAHAENGYVVHVQNAGLYSEERARAICEKANRYVPQGQVHEVMIPYKSVREVVNP